MNLKFAAISAAIALAGAVTLSAQAPGSEYGLPVAFKTREATHYRLPDGSLRAVITIKPHNYLDADGNWKAIDETLKRDVEYVFKNESNGLISRYPNELSDGIYFGSHRHPGVTLKPTVLAAYDAEGNLLAATPAARALALQHDDKTVHYAGVYNGVIDEYVLGPDRVKHNMVLERNALQGFVGAAWLAGEYTLDLPSGWSIEERNRTLRLLDAAGECIYEVGALDAFDASGACYNGAVQGRLDGTVLHLAMRVPMEWLTAPSRQWPVRIDPTLTLQPDGTAGIDTHVVDVYPTNNWGTYSDLTVNWGGGTAQEAFALYNVSSIANTSTVNSAQWEFYHHTNTVTGNIWHIHQVTQTWGETTMLWGTKPTVAASASTTLTYTNGSPGQWRIYTGLATLTQGWVSGTYSNFGLRCVNTTQPNAIAYHYSSDTTNTALRPIFRVDYTTTQPPAVTSVAPNPVNWSQTLTITGTNLLNATAVSVGGTAAAITSNTATQIQVTVADTTPTGAGRVVSVTTAGGTDSTQTVTVNGVAPVLTSAAPDPVAWGATLTITGQNLSSTSAVTIGGTTATISGTPTSTSVAVVVADGTPTGSRTVAVTNSIGTTSNLSVTVNATAPTVTGVAPNPVDWGQTLTITGTYLTTTSAVTIGGVTAAITSATSTQVEVTVDQTTPTGNQVVSVTTGGGTDNTQSVTVNGVPPQITSVAPNPVTWGGTLTITGNFLTGTTAVTIGGTAAAITSTGATQVQVTVADGTPTGSQVVALTTPGGTNNSNNVTVNAAAPVCTSAAPDPVDWTQTLTISGSFLATTSSVTIGGVAQTLGTITTSSIQLTVGYATPTGTQTIVVTTLGGTNNTLTVTVNGLVPGITTAAPDPVQWYQSLTITGTALGNATSVTVGGIALTPTSNTHTQIVVVIPDTMPTGSQAVSVTTALGTDTTSVTVNGAPPVTTSVTPASVVQGNNITITGTGLGNATVTIGGGSTIKVSNSMTQIVVTVTGFVPTGVQTISVTTPHGTASNLTVEVLGAGIGTGGGGKKGGGGGGGCESGSGSAWLLLVLGLLATGAVTRRKRA
ncbi:MAG: IPT/TIG domain-containing protein [Planctomycetes bacterium]|nr:IPT/TIG domain-containing protein [Planctomycetota bacterium]MCW8135572.1 IPT/TIG domain-containing protein [Planctomycetota bacterium]